MLSFNTVPKRFPLPIKNTENQPPRPCRLTARLPAVRARGGVCCAEQLVDPNGPQVPRVASGATRRRTGCLCPRFRGRRNSVSLSRRPPQAQTRRLCVRVHACTPFPASGPSSAGAFLSCCCPHTVTRRCPGLASFYLARALGTREAAAPIAQTRSPGTGPATPHPDCRAGRGSPAGVTDGHRPKPPHKSSEGQRTPPTAGPAEDGLVSPSSSACPGRAGGLLLAMSRVLSVGRCGPSCVCQGAVGFSGVFPLSTWAR